MLHKNIKNTIFYILAYSYSEHNTHRNYDVLVLNINITIIIVNCSVKITTLLDILRVGLIDIF